jgi:hypothetical protein
LTDKLTQIQVKRLHAALIKAGAGSEGITRKFLFAMIAERDQAQVEGLIKGQRAEPAGESDVNE